MSCKLKAERAWAAGFFDGEGTTCVTKDGKSIQLTISQVEWVPIERFRAAIGDPKAVIRREAPRGGISVQPIHKFRLYGDRAIRALRILWPSLCEPKKDQALRALIRYGFRNVTNRGGLSVCSRGHSMLDAYQDPDGYRECATCRSARRGGPLPRSRVTAFEAGVIGRQYVPPNIERAREAVAWTFDMPEDDYEPVAQS